MLRPNKYLFNPLIGKKGKIQVATCTQKDLSVVYKVCVTTMRQWIRDLKSKIGKRKGYKFSPKQVNIIFEEYGIPDDFEFDD